MNIVRRGRGNNDQFTQIKKYNVFKLIISDSVLMTDVFEMNGMLYYVHKYSIYLPPTIGIIILS